MQLSTLFQPTEKCKPSEGLFLEISMTTHRKLGVQMLQLGLSSINYSQSVIFRKGDVVIATDELPSRTNDGRTLLFGRKCSMGAHS